MTDTAVRPFHYGKDVFLYPLLICLVFFFVGGYAVYETSLSAADQTIQHMLQRVKERSLYSLRFEDVDRVNSLVRLMDKAKELARQTEEHPKNLKETLTRFQRDMRLTGAVLLNDKLEADAAVGIASEDWRRIVNMSRLPDVIRWPQKNSMDRIRLHGQFYDYAAVARRDKPGIVLTIDSNDIGERKNGLFTLDILFPDDSFLLKSAVFITDGTVIIDTNEKDWLGHSVAESPLADFETSSQVRSNLVLVRAEGRTWYGARTHVRDLSVYVFSPQTAILQPCWYFAAFMLFVYAVLQTIIMYMRQHSLSAQMRELTDKLKTIQAVSAVFSEGLIASVKDRQFEVIKASESFRSLLSGCRNTDDIVNRIADNVVAPEAREKYLTFHQISTVEARLATSTFGYVDFVFPTRRGHWIRDVLVAQSYDKNGRLVKCLAISRDVTEEKQREIDYQEKLIRTAREAQASATAKTNFLRHMSHDIRTPINGILGMLEIAERHTDDPQRQKACRRHIREASLILLELINDVLDLSKLDARQLNADVKPFNLKQLWEETIPTLEVLSRRRNITINLKKDIRHTNVEGCLTLLRRVVINIITNAIKYNRENGRIDLSVKEETQSPTESMFEFVCRDTGIGMSEDFQRHAFEPFSQESDSARTHYAGTGLGLAIAKRIIEQLGGTITFTSRQNVGTTFTIRVPLKIVPTAAAPRPVSDSAALPAGLSGKRILLAEDNDLNREIAETTLTEAGAQVTAVTDGKEAVNAFLTAPEGTFDLVLMDLMMPNMNGLEATKAIRGSARQDALTIPIVAMTANVFPDDVRATEDAGMNAHIGKPCSAEKLVDVLSHLTA